jgi:alpha,alpha-trehalose phosphorylase
VRLHHTDTLTPKDLYLASVYAVQNRSLGVRHNIEEAGDIEPLRGTFINGFFDTQPIHYGEKAYGFPLTNESMVSVPDAQTIEFMVGGLPIHYQSAKVLKNERSFDLKTGLVERKTTYQHPTLGLFHVATRRFVSAADPGLFLNEWSLMSDTYEGPISIRSTLETKTSSVQIGDPRIDDTHEALEIIRFDASTQGGLALFKTHHTEQYLATVIKHEPALSNVPCSSRLSFEDSFYLSPRQPFKLLKSAHYKVAKNISTLEEVIRPVIDEMPQWNPSFEAHHTQLKSWLKDAEMTIKTHRPENDEAIVYNLFQLATAGGYDDNVSIAAKGLTGKGYHGHTFWDTEMYMVPYFMLHEPQKAYDLIQYRFHQLEAAKNEAHLLGAKRGAKFAWRTITGKENSAYYAAGSAQFHINSAIVHAIIQIYTLHQNHTWMRNTGLPILIETARFFTEVIYDDGTQCHLNNVTGPDEYSAVVNNNFYTNQMIVYQMDFMLEYFKAHPEDLSFLGDIYYQANEELQLFKRIKETLVLLHDEALKIDVQDDGFLQRKPWDFKNTSPEKNPLLLHFHPLTIYRHQVLKQADTVLAHFILQNRPITIMENSYEYYLKRTTHDSSLSMCIYAGMAARLNRIEEAKTWYQETLRIDLDNTHQNTLHGLHLANLGGVHLGLWFGFLGLKIKPILELNPHWPTDWSTFKGQFKVHESKTVNVMIQDQTLTLWASEKIEMKIYDQLFTLTSWPIEFPLNGLNKAY